MADRMKKSFSSVLVLGLASLLFFLSLPTSAIEASDNPPYYIRPQTCYWDGNPEHTPQYVYGSKIEQGYYVYYGLSFGSPNGSIPASQVKVRVTSSSNTLLSKPCSTCTRALINTTSEQTIELRELHPGLYVNIPVSEIKSVEGKGTVVTSITVTDSSNHQIYYYQLSLFIPYQLNLPLVQNLKAYD